MATMDQVDDLFGKIQAVVSKLMTTPDERSSLESLQSSLRANWEEYREKVTQLRETLTDEDDIKALNDQVTRATKTYNLADQGITTKLDHIKVEDEKRDIKPKVDQPPLKSDESKAAENQDAPPGEMHQALHQAGTSGPQQTPTAASLAALESQAETNPDAKALVSLLKQITDQYNQILAGNFPRPTTTEPIVGTAISEKVGSPEDIADPIYDPNDDATPDDEAKASSTTHVAAATKAASTKKAAATTTTTQPCAPQPAAPTSTTVQQPMLDLKVDKIKLPIFNGDLTSWLPFRDQFVDLIHTNPRFTPITKFIQLRGHLQGLALEAINGFKLSASNYDAAWQVLTRRYDKPDRIIDEYLKKLDNLPVLTNPTTQSIIEMVNCANQVLRVLPTLGVDVSTWDTMIKYKLTSKLDRTTHKKWLDEVKLRQKVPLQELIEFLEVEASENLPFVQPRSTARPEQRRPSRQRYPGAAVMATTAKPGRQPKTKPNPQGEASPGTSAQKCQQCKGPHPLYLCETFLKLSVRDRINRVKGFKVCSRCLRTHTNPADCKFGMCPVCNNDHNKLLCYTKEKQDKQSAAQVAATLTE